MSDHDLASMLRWLADRGWKPMLYLDGPSDFQVWVCYPQGAVRAWASFRQPDPVHAVRKLYEFALAHPNDAAPPAAPNPPLTEAPVTATPVSPAPTRPPWQTPTPPIAVEPTGYAPAPAHRERGVDASGWRTPMPWWKRIVTPMSQSDVAP